MVDKKEKTWNIIDLINWGEKYLTEKSHNNSRREVEWFLCQILSIKRIDLYINFEKILTQPELNLFKSYILRRIKGEPFQYIIGKAPFYGREFFVNPEVLIPRPETILIIDILKKKDPVSSALEVGTGSGCLATTLMCENLAKNIIATDISQKALSIAKDNSKYYGAETIQFRKHNFITDPISTQFDIIISNPPYIPLNEIDDLQEDIVKFEPRSALTDGKDGLTFYRRFSEIGKNILNDNGFMLLEIGGDKQKIKIEEIFKKKGFKTNIHMDLQKDPRVIEVAI